MHFHNGGPGVGSLESIGYALLADVESFRSDRRWLTEAGFRSLLRERGLVENRDFHLPSFDEGAPLPLVRAGGMGASSWRGKGTE
jgi:hypothetical protein